MCLQNYNYSKINSIKTNSSISHKYKSKEKEYECPYYQALLMLNKNNTLNLVNILLKSSTDSISENLF